MGQMGFYDLDKRLKAISAKGDPLELIKAAVPWENFRAEIEAAAPIRRYSNPTPA
jgi:transposase, IS5 family